MGNKKKDGRLKYDNFVGKFGIFRLLKQITFTVVASKTKAIQTKIENNCFRCLANYEKANKDLDLARARNKDVALAENK